MKTQFNLDTISKLKLVAGPDDLLLFLTYLWARDTSVFPTKDDRYDITTIMLFQAYTGSRLAEFVDISKGKASQDPLSEVEEADKKGRSCKRGDKDSGYQYEDDSDTSDSPDYDRDTDYNNNEEDDTASNSNLSDTNESTDCNSRYNSDEIDTPMREGYDEFCIITTGRSGEPGQQDCDNIELDEFREVIQKYKVLYYEDIYLQIIQNLRIGERDILVIEIYLRHYRGVDNKPKLYIALQYTSRPG